jgi:hypothetical protein
MGKKDSLKTVFFITSAIEQMKRIPVCHSGLPGFSEGFPTRSACGNDSF